MKKPFEFGFRRLFCFHWTRSPFRLSETKFSEAKISFCYWNEEWCANILIIPMQEMLNFVPSIVPDAEMIDIESLKE